MTLPALESSPWIIHHFHQLKYLCNEAVLFHLMETLIFTGFIASICMKLITLLHNRVVPLSSPPQPITPTIGIKIVDCL